MPGFDPDGWQDVLVYFMAGGFVLLTAVAPVWVSVRGHQKQNKTLGEQNRSLGAIEGQVVNNHKDKNMRDQLDKLEAMVRDGFKETSRDIGGLREELRTERWERIEGDRRYLKPPS